MISSDKSEYFDSHTSKMYFFYKEIVLEQNKLGLNWAKLSSKLNY